MAIGDIECVVKILNNAELVVDGSIPAVMNHKGTLLGQVIVSKYKGETYALCMFEGTSEVKYIVGKLRRDCPVEFLIHGEDGLTNLLVTHVRDQDLIDAVYGWLYKIPDEE